MMSENLVVDVSQDWMSACDVQQRSMLHSDGAAHTLNYSARCRQLRALGGDCYDFLPLSQNRMALAIGDASGKSLAAALMIANVQSSLRTAAAFAGDDPASVVGAVNRQVHASSPADRYATLFYGVFDRAARALHFVNAGHNPPIIIRGSQQAGRLEAGGPPVGVFPDSAYKEDTVQLQPGDLLVAYTDGVTEVLNQAGCEWAVEGLRNAAVQNSSLCADDLVVAIFSSLDEFSQGRQADDATVLVVRVR